MIGQLTESGSLPIGLLVDGVRHRNFVLRPGTVGDQVEALEEVGGTGDNPVLNHLQVGTALFARQLISLGTLPKEKINTELLLQLNPLDWNALDAASMELQKKLMRDGLDSSGGQPVAQSSPATE